MHCGHVVKNYERYGIEEEKQTPDPSPDFIELDRKEEAYMVEDAEHCQGDEEDGVSIVEWQDGGIFLGTEYGQESNTHQTIQNVQVQ